MEQWTALVHSRKSLSTAPLLECSNALKIKGPATRAFYFLVGGTGIEPVTSAV